VIVVVKISTSDFQYMMPGNRFFLIKVQVYVNKGK